LAGKIAPTHGTIKTGQTVKIGYFSQHIDDMDDRLRAIEYIREEAHSMTMANGDRLSASQLMELFLFPPDLQWTNVGRLSGGERRRLYLLRILMSEPNVLLLDEPTNDLDIETLSVLEDFIDKFNGAIVFVSHDRYFIDRLAEKVFVYQKDATLRQFAGGYTDYKNFLEREMAGRAAEREKTDKEKPKEENIKAEKAKEKPKSTKRRLNFKEQREYEEIEAIIASCEGELNAVRRQISMGSSDYVRLEELAKEEASLAEKLDSLMERWAYLEDIVQNS
jgi:ATP-binding cassette subfamily F protein uup